MTACIDIDFRVEERLGIVYDTAHDRVIMINDPNESLDFFALRARDTIKNYAGLEYREIDIHRFPLATINQFYAALQDETISIRPFFSNVHEHPASYGH